MNDGAITTPGLAALPKNIHGYQGASESMMSYAAPGSTVSNVVMRRRQDKQIRNFKYLYEE